MKAPGQERFTRLKTLGIDYTEETLSAWNAGHPRPSRQPKEHGGKISLLIDIQNNIKARQSAGYKRWATIENLKRFVETSNFLTEHGISSYEKLAEKCEAVTAASDRIKAGLREVNTQMDTLASHKVELKAEQQRVQREERQYAAIQQNVDEFLSAPAPEQQHQRKQELE